MVAGPPQAGYHRLRWNGHDDAGRPMASGMYLYRLGIDEVVLTRKLTLLRRLERCAKICYHDSSKERTL